MVESHTSDRISGVALNIMANPPPVSMDRRSTQRKNSMINLADNLRDTSDKAKKNTNLIVEPVIVSPSDRRRGKTVHKLSTWLQVRKQLAVGKPASHKVFVEIKRTVCTIAKSQTE
jgi:hypothetical protein